MVALCCNWIWQRLLCLLRGHRQLSIAPDYGEMLPDGCSKQLYFCDACDCRVWIKRTPLAVRVGLDWRKIPV